MTEQEYFASSTVPGLYRVPPYLTTDTYGEWRDKWGKRADANRRLNRIANAGPHDGWLWLALNKPHPTEPFQSWYRNWKLQLLMDGHDHLLRRERGE